MSSAVRGTVPVRRLALTLASAWASGGRDPASIRYNNPGAQYPSRELNVLAWRDMASLAVGTRLQNFPHPKLELHRIFDLLSRRYTGMQRLVPLAKNWTGGYGLGVPGYDPNAIITKEMMNDPKFAIPFLRSIAGREAGRKSPLTQEQWERAHRMFREGGIKPTAPATTGTTAPATWPGATPVTPDQIRRAPANWPLAAPQTQATPRCAPQTQAAPRTGTALRGRAARRPVATTTPKIKRPRQTTRTKFAPGIARYAPNSNGQSGRRSTTAKWCKISGGRLGAIRSIQMPAMPAITRTPI